jgi:prepilin-type N-terminal cleavage/methylation domain-containing protein
MLGRNLTLERVVLEELSRLIGGRLMTTASVSLLTADPPGRQAGRRRAVRTCHKAGFTLIEVLVVVAIIALLIAILVPALSRVRTHAMIATCKANCKQVGTGMATYQAECGGYVPVVFNVGSRVYGVPARTTLLSVALRSYDKGTSQLAQKYGGQYDPEAVWSDETQRRYEQQISPEHFVCPFARGKGSADPIRLADQGAYRVYEYPGRYETYETWMWEGDVVRGMVPISALGEEVYPADPVEGRPRYSVLSWNMATAEAILNKPGRASMVPPNALNIDHAANAARLKDMPRRWSDVDARRVKAASLSDTTAIYCSRGNFLALSRAILNPGSHRTSAGAGTNAVFADTHVEWVKGTRIGWP